MEILTPQQQLRREIAKKCKEMKDICERDGTHSIDLSLIIKTKLEETEKLCRQLIALPATWEV